VGGNDGERVSIELSERTTRRRTTGDRAKQRQRGPRSARKQTSTAVGAASPAAAAAVASGAGTAMPATRSRRLTASTFRPIGLTRTQEYDYIRSDIRRLFVVAGGMFALMLVILVVLTR
jgi:hypothetical protein